MDKIKDKSYLLLLTDLLTGREEQCREITTSDHMIHWEHFNDVFMTSAITGDGVDELRVIIICVLLFTCCHNDGYHSNTCYVSVSQGTGC